MIVRGDFQRSIRPFSMRVLVSFASMTFERTLTQLGVRVLWEGRDSRHQARESGRTLWRKRGTAFSLCLRGVMCPSEAYHHMDRYQFERCYKARSKTPASVKPCSGEQRGNRASEEIAHGATAMSRQEYKGYKKRVQGKVFHESIENMHVTLTELSRRMLTLNYRKV
jgi:hypothetical protein